MEQAADKAVRITRIKCFWIGFRGGDRNQTRDDFSRDRKYQPSFAVPMASLLGLPAQEMSLH